MWLYRSTHIRAYIHVVCDYIKVHTYARIWMFHLTTSNPAASAARTWSFDMIALPLASVTHSCVWHGNSCVTWLTHVWCDNCVTWLIHVCAMTYSCVTWLMHSVTWLVICRTNLVIRRDCLAVSIDHSFMCVAWLVHMCDVTHAYVWHDTLICRANLVLRH